MTASTTGRSDHWQTVYQSKDETEVSWFQPRPETSLDLIRGSGIGTAARIVDVGGGASRLVDNLLAQGFRQITVLDIAAAGLAKSQARLGPEAAKVDWVAADVTQWQPPHPYDLWHDRAVFHFLTEEADRQAYLRTIAAALPPGAQAIIGTFAADGPERCSGLPVQRYDADALAAFFSPAFRLLEGRREEHLTPGGKTQNFQFCRLLRC